MIREIDFLRISRGAVPRGLPVENVGSAACRIQSASHEADEKTVAGRGFDAAIDFFIEYVFREYPESTSHGGGHEIDLSYSGHAVLETRKRSIVIPGTAGDRDRAVFLNRQFAEWTDVPLRVGFRAHRIKPMRK